MIPTVRVPCSRLACQYRFGSRGGTLFRVFDFAHTSPQWTQDANLQYLGVDNYLFYGKVVTWPQKT